MLHRRLLGAFALATTTVLAACDDDDSATAPEVGTIVEVAAEAGQFNTLLTAVDAAGLSGALSDPGASLTVFAPTDAAFAALPAGTVDALLADPDALAEILLFHVVGEAQDANQVTGQSFIETLNGQFLAVRDEGGVTISGAALVTADIPASNGVIHVIDAVMLPETRSIVQIAIDAGFDTLAQAVVAAGLADTLSDEDAEFTVFAPTDEAFAALPAGTLDALLADPSALAEILLYHTVEGRVFSDEVVAASSVQTVSGLSAPIDASGTGVTIDGADIVVTDIQASNGVIHVIDAVILP